MVSVIILAAGESTRMGSPKPLLKINNKSFLTHIVDICRGSELDDIVIVLGYEAESILRLINLQNMKIVINENYQRGQLSSIQTGLQSLPQDIDGVLVWPVDRPLISPDLIKKLVNKFTETYAPVVVPVYKTKRGHPIIFSKSVFEELMNAPIEVGARAIVWSHQQEIAEVLTDEEGVLLNIDSPEEYQKYVISRM